jgi:hypothetical protein
VRPLAPGGVQPSQVLAVCRTAASNAVAPSIIYLPLFLKMELAKNGK